MLKKKTNEMENNTVDTKDVKGQARENNNFIIASHTRKWMTIPMEVPFISPKSLLSSQPSRST